MRQGQSGISCRPVYLISDLMDVSKWCNGLGEIGATESAIKVAHSGIECAALIFVLRFDAPDKGCPAVLIVFSKQFQGLICRVLRIGELMKLGIDGSDVREDTCLKEGALEFGAEVERPA